MIRKSTYGYTVEKNNIFLDIVFYDHNIVRFVYSKDDKLPNSTIAIVAKPKKIEAVLDYNKINTNSLSIHIDEDNLKVSIYDLNGNLLNKDSSSNFNEKTLEKELLWEKGFYGIGEKYGWVNKKGTDTVNWCSDVIGHASIHSSIVKEYHTAIPFYIGLDLDKAYGIYHDNSFRTYFDFGKADERLVKYRTDGGNVDYYFIYGENISDVVKGYSYLTGTMPLPRKDFLGYQQCRWSYENREELMSIATKMREENIPCDVLYLDIDYMKDYKVFTVDSDKFFEFKEMNKKLKEMGFKLVVIIDPGVKVEEGYNVYEEGVTKNYFVKDYENKIYVGEVWPGDSVFPDFLRSDVRIWWGELHKELVENGVDGIWNDMNEPANFITDTKTLPEDTVHITDKGEKKKHSEIHNIYGMLEAEATYEGLKKIQNKRPFVLTRAGYAGTQRYAALWTGDNTSVWEHLESSISMFINLGLSGYSYIGGDVGGFLGDSNGELLARWTQLGVFTPLFRNHSAKGTIHQEPWCFGEDTLEITRKYIKLRYKLITYLYNIMRESSISGEPIIRPLFYHYQNDEKTYNINDQFLFGENILICPITRPNTNTRMVYLPEGDWYDYWTKERLVGGKYIIKEADINTLPIFIKNGSIIPMDEEMNYIGENEKNLEFHFYCGNNGKYKLYLDDGISFDYELGKYSEIEFVMEENSEEVMIKTNIMKNDYKIPKFNFNLHGSENKKIIFNNKELSKEDLKEITL